MFTPIITITVIYVLGIIAGQFLPLPIQISLPVLILSALSTLVMFRKGQKPIYLLIFTIFLSGTFACHYSNIVPANDASNVADERYVNVVGTIADEPACTEENIRFTLQAKKIKIGGKTSTTSGRISVYVNDPSLRLNYGNEICVSGKLSKIASTLNPGITSFGDLMAKRKVRSQMFTSAKNIDVISRPIGNPLKYISIGLKNKLMSVIQHTMHEPYSSLLGSIVFGSQTSPLSNELQDNYRTAGVIHLLVVSGTQVSIILSSVIAVCGYFGLAGKIRLMIVTFANMMFTIMVGAGPSIVRAAVMCEAALIANAFERDNDFYNSMCLSALILLVMNPLNLFDMGFQLSFIATWALFYVAPVIEERIKKHAPSFLTGAIAVSIAPTITTSPVILYNFGQISFVSILSNFLILPWVEMTVILGFMSTLVGLLSLPLACVLNNTLTLMLALLNGMVYFFSGLPFACRYFVPPDLFVILIYYIMLIGAIEHMRGRIKIRMKLSKAAIFLGLLLLAGCLFLNGSHAEGDLVVTFMDVGQGDSILIESPSGQKALIDGGGRQENASSTIKREDPVGRSVIVPFLRKKGINELNLVILTHPDDDHVAGLPYVLEKIKVDMVLDGGQPHTSRGYYRFLKLIELKRIPYKIARAGQVIDLGEGVKGYVLHPSEPLIKGAESVLNNNSVVIKLDYGKTSFLFMGDTGFEGEGRILSKGYSLVSDVLKVGHHGSMTSTSIKLLESVMPKYAVISVGAKNKFGHPSPETLRRMGNYGVKVLRTDLKGAIIFRSDGTTVHPQ